MDDDRVEEVEWEEVDEGERVGLKVERRKEIDHSSEELEHAKLYKARFVSSRGSREKGRMMKAHNRN